MKDPTSTNHPWDEWPQADGVITRFAGPAIVVLLDDEQEIHATFPKRVGCILGNPIGWRVRVAFRPQSTKPAFVIKRYRAD